MTMLLWDGKRGPIGEIGDDLIESRWESGRPIRGTLILKGSSLLINHLMECAYRPMWVMMTDEIADGLYRVVENSYVYKDSVWTSQVELHRSVTS